MLIFCLRIKFGYVQTRSSVLPFVCNGSHVRFIFRAVCVWNWDGGLYCRLVLKVFSMFLWLYYMYMKLTSETRLYFMYMKLTSVSLCTDLGHLLIQLSPLVFLTLQQSGTYSQKVRIFFRVLTSHTVRQSAQLVCSQGETKQR